MKRIKKIVLLLLIAVIATFAMVGCTDADVVSTNISRAADQFEVFRRVVFYNGITDTYILVIEGYCSVGVDVDGDFFVVVKTDNGEFLKHYLGLSDNVTYFAEQLENIRVSDAHYRVIFKPSVIIPHIDLE